MREATVEEITDAIIDYRGKTPPKATEGIPLLTAKVIKGGTIDGSRLEFISEETYAWWMRRGFPTRRDILLTTEAPLGETAILRGDDRVALAQRVVLLRGNPTMVDQDYFFAALRSPLVQDRLKQRATGTTVLGIKQRELRQVLVPLPSLEIQRKIGAIVAAYDDLIENNSRRINILEEMARRLYREWFVDLRYPEHEGDRLVDSELGMIPEGWDMRAFEALGTYVNGFAFKPTDWGSEGPPIIKIRELKNGVTEDTPRFNGDLPPKYVIRDGDLLFSWSADLDAYLWTGGPAWLNQHLFRVDPLSDIPTAFLFHALKERMAAFRSLSQGTTMRHIKRKALSQVMSMVPPEGLRHQFADLAAPIDGLALALVRATRSARETRDLLLPRLISGEIDVGDLDIAAPALAA
jgi:type I restriction enzyme S subunit